MMVPPALLVGYECFVGCPNCCDCQLEGYVIIIMCQINYLLEKPKKNNYGPLLICVVLNLVKCVPHFNNFFPCYYNYIEMCLHSMEMILVGFLR